MTSDNHPGIKDRAMMNGNERALVSVIIPSYNSARFLPATLDSVLSQTYPNVEIIVVDDGSQDDTKDVIAPFRHQIVYHHQVNFGGPSQPRNVGISLASGEYISFFDSDDLMQPDKLEVQMAVFSHCSEVDFVCSDFSMIDGGGTQLKNRFLDEYDSFRENLQPSKVAGCSLLSGRNLFHALIKTNFIGTSSVVARKAALEEVGGFDETLLNSDDIDMWRRLALAGKVLAFVNSPLHAYRKRASGISSRGLGRYPSLLRGLEKQLPHVNDSETMQILKDKIFIATLGYGWYLMAEKDYRAARTVFRKVSRTKLTRGVLKGLVLSLLFSLTRPKAS